MEKRDRGLHSRHRVVASVLSTIGMGLGQVYNGQIVKGILYLLLEIYVLIFWTHPFLQAMWGLITLGDTPQKRARGRIVVEGDHSIFLMIGGLIFLLLFLLFLFVYYQNIRDAYLNGKLRDQGFAVPSFKQTLKNVWEKGYPYILLTPTLLFTLFLTVLPLLFGILIAFTNYSAPYHLPPKTLVDWVGFKSFIDLFQLKTWSTTFYGVITWNIIWAVVSTFTTYFAGLFYATIINHKRIRLKKLWRSIFILPWAIPQFIAILIFRNIFNGQFGPINKMLMDMGFQGIPWLSDPFWAKVTIIVVNIWFGFPYWMALMSGVLTGIDREMYEAADVDGATGMQKFWKLTVPMVLYATMPLLIMSFAFNFNNFNMIYLLTSGGPANPNYSFAGSTDILISWIYKLTLDQSQFNMASVVSILIFIVVATFSIWNFSRTRAFKEEDMM
ncbi:putative arabinogalactan oligomer transport system permease protein ganP [[Clostridium] ultunense Esp]|uniref:carbohydrate ABC transporter permease n=1 Tax=Thermicanus aegyptius TaxID=94009 RepID=UPI0002B703F8|nr:sugar ABC transporter permease [Thermicanus aegyptius]CCQ98359.1 putative arabinogalactan oligomer transport system permease protein ganP [[Clostridium] ultunense Esp]